jgi:hypothetical protein
MIHVTREMLPTLRTAAGFVTISRPLPCDALLTPAMAISYASSLIEAAAKAEGDRLIHKRARARRQSASG